MLDVRGPGPGVPAFGLGVLQGRPFLIYRELQRDGDGWVGYTFLLEPRREDFELYRWNGAWLLASLLADTDARRLLIDEPDNATEHTLGHALDRCTPIALVEDASAELLGGLLVRSSLEGEKFTASMTGVNLDPQTRIESMAAALHKVPIAFRTGRGWLVRGVDSHAAILGCALLFEGPSPVSADPGAGYKALARLEGIAAGNEPVADLLGKPYSDWDARGQGLLHGLRILEQLDTRTVQGWDLLQSVPAREGLLKSEIRAAALRTMELYRQPLPFEPTMLMLEDADAGNRTLAPDLVERLDHGALVRFLVTHQTPPNPWPAWMATPRTLKAELWTRTIESAKDGWAGLVRRALEDLSPEGHPDPPAFGVVAAGIAKARAAGTSPGDWSSFAQHPELRSLLANWSLENVKKMRGDWQATYLTLGDDPGGRALAKTNVAAPVAARLVTYMWDQLAGPNGTLARAWIDALATSPLRDVVPIATKLELAVTAGGRWTTLERLRRAYEGDAVSGEPASPEESAYLLRELEAMAQSASRKTPDLAAIHAVLGADLPEHVQRAVMKWTRPARTEKPATAEWLKGVAQRLKDVAAPRPPAEEKSKPAAAPPPPKPKPVASEKPKPAAAPPPKPVVTGKPRFTPPPPPPKPVIQKPKAAPSPPPPPSPLPPVPVVAEPPKAAPPPPVPVAAPQPAPPAPAVIEPVEPIVQPIRSDLRERLRQWIAGGNTADDRTGDEELLKLFGTGNANELAAARTIIEGFSPGLLYRLAGRSIANPHLLDGIARVLGGAMLDRIVRDAVHYDITRFAKVGALRLALNHPDGWSDPVDQAILRVLRSGDPELRKELNREFAQIDATLIEELARAIDPPASTSEDAA